MSKTVLGHIDCPTCGKADAMRITADRNGDPFGFCEDGCGQQLRVGGKPGRVRAFVARYPWASASPVTVTVPEPAPAPAPKPVPVAAPATPAPKVAPAAKLPPAAPPPAPPAPAKASTWAPLMGIKHA